MNKFVASRMQAIQAVLMAHYDGSIDLPAAMKGSERETFIHEFLEKVLPEIYRFGKGAITDSNSAISGAVDIVIELPFTPSFPMPTTSDRLYLAESVGAVIEVKSDLAKQWKEVESTVGQVKTLHRQGETIIKVGGGLSPQIPCYAVGYKGYTTVDGLKQRIDSTTEEKRPDGALVIESGCFVTLSDTSGYGISTACGSMGLYALIWVLLTQISQVIFARPHLSPYANIIYDE